MILVSINRIYMAKYLVYVTFKNVDIGHMRFILTADINQTFSRTYAVYVHYWHKPDI
jgi:hypothetical protein